MVAREQKVIRQAKRQARPSKIVVRTPEAGATLQAKLSFDFTSSTVYKRHRANLEDLRTSSGDTRRNTPSMNTLSVFRYALCLAFDGFDSYSLPYVTLSILGSPINERVKYTYYLSWFFSQMDPRVGMIVEVSIKC